MPIHNRTMQHGERVFETRRLRDQLCIEPNETCVVNATIAYSQSSTRLSRGVAFASYIAPLRRAPPRKVIIEACGHDPRCVYTADGARRALFSER